MSDDGPKSRRSNGSGVSRRDFITSAGIGAVGIAAVGQTPAGASTSDGAVEVTAGERVPAQLEINGYTHRLLVEPRWSLAFVLREKLGITSTKAGCERGECGSCTVLIDDEPRYSCMTLVLEVEGRRITTLEGLLEGEALGAVQKAFLEHDGYQCGYCTSGQILAVEGLLRRNPDPTLADIRLGVSGNLCRCGAYVNIFKAARKAAELKAGKGGMS